MSDNVMIFIAKKETFLVRALIKKVKDSGIDCRYVTDDIDAINAAGALTGLITFFMEESDVPDEKVLHFLSDKLEEDGGKMILISNGDSTQRVNDHIPDSLIFGTFVRPIDNELYLQSVTEYYERSNAGDFKKSILIVDDDPGYLNLVRGWLKGDYRVSMAASGLQAIKWLGKNKVDLILLDHEMPVTSGPQVLEMLRSDEETRSIPVMFLTGKSDRESVMAVVALHPEGYFLKTISKEELLEKLKEYFVLHK